MSDCDAELCPSWGGGGCICDVLGLPHDPICEETGERASLCLHCEEAESCDE